MATRAKKRAAVKRGAKAKRSQKKGGRVMKPQGRVHGGVDAK